MTRSQNIFPTLPGIKVKEEKNILIKSHSQLPRGVAA